MSGGFFRGTSADQDTRFSNKQAKLLKSQKFPPELDHLVDVSKVKMDVIKPWIATRVTELLGFEDEVLINFIYGLLDQKDVNGKEVQIQITGFMEKNTGKFMKELWGLLLSAQNNASGVPQQFLDAKEEEIRKKKVEADRITHEIQKKKEVELEKQKKMDEAVAISKAVDDAANRNHSAQHEDDRGSGERNGFRGKNRSSRSPHSVEHSPSVGRVNRSRSISKSFSNSRSYSDDRHKSRSVSRSPQSRGRSISPDIRYRSPRKRSLTPRRNYSPRRPRSPIRRRSPHLRRRPSPYSWRRSPSPRRRRSPSPRRRRSPSPRRRRSPSPRGRRSLSPVLRGSPSLKRRRSPTPVRRRSPTPVRHRSSSIMRRRSPSPVRRRSPLPIRRRSPSPLRRRSPSPLRRRSPIAIRKRSPSPTRYRSQSPLRGRSPSPVRRRSPPLRGRSPSPVRRRSPPRSPRRRRKSPLQSPGQTYRSSSPPYRRRRSLSREYDDRANGVGSRRYRDDYAPDRNYGKKSPPRIHEREIERSGQRHNRLDSVARHPPISMRSPQRDPGDQSDAGRKMPVSLPSGEISSSHSGSSLHTGKSSPSEDRRTSSPSDGPRRNIRERIRADSTSPVRQTRNIGARHDSHGAVKEERTHASRVDGGQGVESPQRRVRHSPSVGGNRNIPTKESRHEEYSPERLAGRKLGEAEHRLDDIEIRRKDRDKKSEKVLKMDRPLSPIKSSPPMMESAEHGPRRVEAKRFSPDSHDEHPDIKQQNSPLPKRSIKSYPREDYKVDEKKRAHSGTVLESDPDSDNEKNKMKKVERRKHKRHHAASDDDTSNDSHIDERKEAKRRRKEEKRLRKEEKRRRREERHRKKEERRAGKLKARTMDTVTPSSDVEKNQSDAYESDDHVAAKINSHPSDAEAESEQKKLEIELRKKALESLRAKKAINS